MKKKIAALVSLFFTLIVVFAPIKLAENFIPVNNQLSVSGMQGSLWSGKVDRVEFKGWKLQKIDYSLSFLSLIFGTISGSGEIHRGDVEGDFSFELEDRKNIQIEHANLEVSALHFEKYIPFPGIELSGKLSTQNLQLKLANHKPVLLVGGTSWSGASLDLNGKQWKLGDLDIIWHTKSKNGEIIGEISKVKKNELGLEGRFSLTKNGQFEFKGSIKAAIDKTIYAAFSLFANGTVKNGRLPIKFKKKIL